MSKEPSSLKQVEEVLADGPRNAVELVEELLSVLQSQGMRLDWQDGQCRFQCLPLNLSESGSVPLPLSVFRTVLARLAVLCNTHRPDSVSPYGGEGAFCWKSHKFQVVFSNNNQQGCHLQISPLEQTADTSHSQSASIPRAD